MEDAYEWDEEKNKRNIEQHGLSLAAGIPVFDDNCRLEYQDRRVDYGEDRFITIGHNGYTDILYVCYTMRGHGKTRLISVRPATRKERHKYEQSTRW